jgi:hypothetical protein
MAQAADRPVGQAATERAAAVSLQAERTTPLRSARFANPSRPGPRPQNNSTSRRSTTKEKHGGSWGRNRTRTCRAGIDQPGPLLTPRISPYLFPAGETPAPQPKGFAPGSFAPPSQRSSSHVGVWLFPKSFPHIRFPQRVDSRLTPLLATLCCKTPWWQMTNCK